MHERQDFIHLKNYALVPLSVKENKCPLKITIGMNRFTDKTYHPCILHARVPSLSLLPFSGKLWNGLFTFDTLSLSFLNPLPFPTSFLFPLWRLLSVPDLYPSFSKKNYSQKRSDNNHLQLRVHLIQYVTSSRHLRKKK